MLGLTWIKLEAGSYGAEVDDLTYFAYREYGSVWQGVVIGPEGRQHVVRRASSLAMAKRGLEAHARRYATALG